MYICKEQTDIQTRKLTVPYTMYYVYSNTYELFLAMSLTYRLRSYKFLRIREIKKLQFLQNIKSTSKQFSLENFWDKLSAGCY